MSYVRIKNNYKLREEPCDAIIFNYNVENILKKIHRIPKFHFAVLTLVNGQFTKKDLIQIYSKASLLSYEDSENIINNILEHYKEYIEYINYQDIRNNLIIKRKIVCEEDNDNFSSFHRLSSPLLLSLVLTYQCLCSCKYCYVNASQENNSPVLETKKVLDIIEQAKQIGVSSINITGGDPFIRHDIFQIIEKCITSDISINISTKKFLNANEIKLLKKIKLNNLQVSIDALDNNISEYLTGINNFAQKMIKTIELLIASNIDVTVNSVVTKMNIKEVPILIKKLNSMGVRRHLISPYLKTLGRHDDKLFPDVNDYNYLNDFINKYSGKMEVNYKSPNYNFIETKNLENIHRCTGGRMGLVIAPNGEATICERLIDSKECVVGDINSQSLKEIWNSKKLKELIYPNRNKFENTDCYECNSFIDCVLDKGLCYARSKIAYDTIYNKDPLCPNETQYVRFV